MAFTSRISGKGQVTIPKKIRETLGASPGDLIAYEVNGNIVTLKRIGPFDAAYHASLSQTLDEWTTAEDEEAFHDL
ncbi:MAG: AbrB/MazE/SpoVT family DNA-binding domain-containing protein [Acidobacteriia bacterium]|nr:AbrB/MazE/SpoVT family DNA-binding domain-containing protein [Terriglobia bacterium]